MTGTSGLPRLYKSAESDQSLWGGMHDIEQIIARVLAGDTEQYRLLVWQHECSVFGFVHNLVRNQADAEDLSQEVFVAAFIHLDSFDPKRAKFSTWLLTIARNRCYNFLKRRSLATGAVAEVASDALPPEAEMANRETWSRLDAALDRLTIEQRTAFVLIEIQEMPLAEVAAIEGVPVGTVKSRLSRAKANLRRELSDWQPVQSDAIERPSPRGAS